MNEKLAEAINLVRDDLVNTREYLALKSAEEKLNDQEVIALVKKKDEAISDYQLTIGVYKRNSLEALRAQKAMAIAIKNLKNNELVKSYDLAYKAYKVILNGVSKELFSFLEEQVDVEGDRREI
jgi:cell fate (sporulation/competence/biofilm development) regulator YlbF (YheA/YmcA/DUF963 family)